METIIYMSEWTGKRWKINDSLLYFQILKEAIMNSAWDIFVAPDMPAYGQFPLKESFLWKSKYQAILFDWNWRHIKGDVNSNQWNCFI